MLASYKIGTYHLLRKFAVLLLFFSSFSYAQHPDTSNHKEIEKLQKELNEVAPHKKGGILLKLSELYWREKPSKAIEYGKQAIVFYHKKDISKLPDAYINTAIAFYYLGEMDSTIYYSKKIITDSQNNLSEQHYGVLYNILCVANRRKGNYPLALDYGEKALDYFNKTKDSTRIPGTLDNMASIYERMGDYKKSLDFSLQSLQAFEHNKDTANMAATHFNIANLYASIENWDKATLHLDASTDLSKKTNDNYLLADSYNNYGTLYLDTNRPDLAFDYLTKALKIYNKLGVNSGIAVATQNMGLVFAKKKEYTQAITYLNKAIQLFEKLHSLGDLTEAYRDLGDTYKQTNQLGLSEHFLQLSLQNAQKIHSANLQLKALQSIRELYHYNKNYKKAYQYEVRFHALKDSIENNHIKQQMAELDKKYQNEKKEKEIKILKSNEKIQKERSKTLLIIIGSLGVFIILGYYFIHQKRKKEKAISTLELEQATLKKQQLEQELEYKNKQLASHAINIMQRNKMLQSYLNILEEIEPDSNCKTPVQYKSLKRTIHKTIQSKKDWESFKTYFEETNKSFVDSLMQQNPDLTNNDFRLAALIKLGMTNKEIASIFNISSQSVKNALYRLKKKMHLNEKENVRSFLKKL